MSIVAIIPSRYKSSRFKGKPLALINNKPMIHCVYERVLKSLRVDSVYVATDDERIQKTVINFGGKVIMTSPFHHTGTDRVAEAANLLGLDNQDIIINVQGDQPLINHRCLDTLIDHFSSKINFEIITLALPIKNIKEIENPKDVKVTFDLKGYALYFSRSNIPYGRDAKAGFLVYKHLGLYAYRKKFLDVFCKLTVGNLENIEKLEQLRPMEYGYRVFVALTAYDSPEVDLPEDIKIIENKIKFLS